MNKKPPAQANGKKANKAVLPTILFVAFVILAFAIIACVVKPNTKPIELPKTILERLIGEAAEAAYQNVSLNVDDALGKAYAPVYAAIPDYTDFHYSIIGSYTEDYAILVSYMNGGINKTIQDQLFNGFDERLSQVYDNLGGLYNKEFSDELDRALESELQSGFEILGPITEKAVNAAKYKITTSSARIVKLALGSRAGSATLAVGGKITEKFIAKFAIKGATKGGGAILGATIGATACLWTGPFTSLCGAIGLITGWLLTDGIVVNISEIWGSEEFKVDLKAIIDEHKQATSTQIKMALQGIAIENGVSKESFTLQNLSTGE